MITRKLLEKSDLELEENLLSTRPHLLAPFLASTHVQTPYLVSFHSYPSKLPCIEKEDKHFSSTQLPNN